MGLFADIGKKIGGALSGMGNIGKTSQAAKKPAPKKPAPQRAAAKPIPYAPPKVPPTAGGPSPIQVAAEFPQLGELPMGSYPGGAYDDLSSQLNPLNAQMEALNREATGARKTAIQEQLAAQLRDATQAQEWQDQDVGLKKGQLSAQLPKTLDVIAGQSAARGAFHSQGRQNVQQEERDETQRQLDDIQRDADRDRWQREMAKQSAQQSADRELADIERQNRAAELEGKISSVKQQAEANRSEATAWTKARVNQLLAAGLDTNNARSVAIAEARDNWSNVAPTFIEGAFAPPAAAKPVPGFSTVISGKRGQTVTPDRVEIIKRGEWYNRGGGLAVRNFAANYLKSGAPREANSFMSAYLAHMQRQNAAGTIDPATGKPRKKAVPKSELIKELELRGDRISLIMMEAGIM